MNNPIELKNVFKSYPSYQNNEKFINALTDINLTIKENSITLISGANGSGKSVLMNIIAGLEKPSKGTVKTTSKPGLIFQDANIQILGDTVYEDVCIGPKNQKKTKSEVDIIVENALRDVSLYDKSNNLSEFLSGGEKRRLATASIISMNRNILIFDEPYANLDYPSVVDVNNLIKKLHNQGKTIIVLTHELEKIMGLSTHFVVLFKGHKVFDGSPENAFNENLENWGIKNPLTSYKNIKDLVW